MKVIPYDTQYRSSVLELMCLLQDHERTLSPDRPPSADVSALQLDYLLSATPALTGAFLIAIDDDVAVGLIVGFQDHEPEGTHHVYPDYQQFGLITDFVVSTSYQGKGVAGKLLAEAKAFCKTLGLQSLRLSVLQANQRVRGFYEKAGFKPYEVTYRQDI